MPMKPLVLHGSIWFENRGWWNGFWMFLGQVGVYNCAWDGLDSVL